MPATVFFVFTVELDTTTFQWSRSYLLHQSNGKYLLFIIVLCHN